MPLPKKILIANRGEIALRVIRACKEMGISTVAVHSDCDSEALHVKLADEAVCIGPPDPRKSYLNIVSIMSAAEVTGADAIHPGYGFLSENQEFARICEKCNVKFIGPSWESMAQMGRKIQALQLMSKSGVPTLPGFHEPIRDAEQAKKVAADIGYPVILKASAGGGGRGMQIVHSEDELNNAVLRTQSEATLAFGVGDVYIEKYVERPRHVEIQILADEHGNVLHLGERDCSIQRRHQKLIEESPCPVLTPELRAKMGEAAVRAAKAVNYANAGTIEFLLDQKGKFYFMEMNTRVQVEHPVTEMVTGIDIVHEQILIAAGEKLRYKQEDIQMRGHSIECRINAEDPEKFLPCPGLISAYHAPGGLGVRVDSAVYADYVVPRYYDSLIAKLVVWGGTRSIAIARMKRALSEYMVDGIKTNIPFHKKVMENKDYRAGKVDTSFIAKHFTT